MLNERAHYWKAPSQAIADEQFNKAYEHGDVEILFKV